MLACGGDFFKLAGGEGKTQGSFLPDDEDGEGFDRGQPEKPFGRGRQTQGSWGGPGDRGTGRCVGMNTIE
jgi:hypothetical protein